MDLPNCHATGDLSRQGILNPLIVDTVQIILHYMVCYDFAEDIVCLKIHYFFIRISTYRPFDEPNG